RGFLEIPPPGGGNGPGGGRRLLEEHEGSDSDALDVAHVSFSGTRRRATTLPRRAARPRITKGSRARTTGWRRLTRNRQEKADYGSPDGIRKTGIARRVRDPSLRSG